MTKWHAPGMGEVHSEDDKIIIQCIREGDDEVELACDETAQMVCDRLNADYRTAMNEVIMQGYVNKALDSILAENSPDAIFNMLGDLCGKAISIALNIPIKTDEEVRAELTEAFRKIGIGIAKS